MSRNVRVTRVGERLQRVLEIGAHPASRTCKGGPITTPLDGLLQSYRAQSAKEEDVRRGDQLYNAVWRLLKLGNIFTYTKHMPDNVDDDAWMIDFERNVINPFLFRFREEDREMQLRLYRNAISKFKPYFSRVNCGNLRDASPSDYRDVLLA